MQDTVKEAFSAQRANACNPSVAQWKHKISALAGYGSSASTLQCEIVHQRRQRPATQFGNCARISGERRFALGQMAFSLARVDFL
jgi:hypothetical protein